MPYLSRLGVPVYSEEELRAVQVFAIEHPGLPKGDPKAETGESFFCACHFKSIQHSARRLPLGPLSK
jgi:hypothetical protein